MDTILQNRIIITDNGGNPSEYFLEKALPYPIEDSDRPVESRYLYQLERKLVHFLGRGVTNKIFAGNANVPTSSAVYDAIKELSNLDPAKIPAGCTLVFLNTDGYLYYQDGDTLKKINIATGPVNNPSVSYDAATHSIVFGGSENTGVSEVTP